jgi:hypothetical protein
MIKINLIDKNCGCKRFKEDKLVYCNGKGRWQHPRYYGVFCDDCKKTVEVFFSSGWTETKEDKNGKKTTKKNKNSKNR